MTSYQIKKISSLTQELVERIVPGYTSDQIFRIRKTDDGNQMTFTLSLEKIEPPFFKKHDYSNPSVLAHYNSIAAQGNCYGIFYEKKCIGFLLSEIQSWNSTMIVREFGIQPDSRKQGFGKALMAHVIEKAKFLNLRSIFCETQNTNVDAIEFYKKVGFKIDGMDLSFYQNEDQLKREMAIFLRYDLD